MAAAREDLADVSCARRHAGLTDVCFKGIKNATDKRCPYSAEAAERERFICGLQRAFAAAVIEEYGEQEEEVISRQEVESSIDAKGAHAFQILCGGGPVGGVAVSIDGKTRHNSMDLFYIDESYHGRGIGQATWKQIERMFPDTEFWKTVTPYFEKRNIHFYGNKCSFKIVELFNPHPPDQCDPDGERIGTECFFRFEKMMGGGRSS